MAKKKPDTVRIQFPEPRFQYAANELDFFSWRNEGDLLQQGGASAIVEPKQEEPLFSLVAIHR